MNELFHLASTLHSIVASRSLSGGRAVHACLIKLHQNAGRLFSLHNKLINLYSQCVRQNLAHKLFDKMPERDVVSFNTLISTTLRLNRDPFIGFSLYIRLLDEGLSPNSITFASLLSSSSVLSNVQLLEQIHCHSIKFGLNSNGFVGSTFVNGYERCRGLKDALCAFEDIAEIDSVSWNIMIDACARSGCKENAVKVFARMQRECSNRFC